MGSKYFQADWEKPLETVDGKNLVKSDHLEFVTLSLCYVATGSAS